mmetsp:Transcript_7351/g.18076  ORF Transcript_7351/g.18076 Transcript_7351/m.18076 type:complete len:101 (+) Transcript_7351:1053-1355(+)
MRRTGDPRELIPSAEWGGVAAEKWRCADEGRGELVARISGRVQYRYVEAGDFCPQSCDELFSIWFVGEAAVCEAETLPLVSLLIPHESIWRWCWSSSGRP